MKHLTELPLAAPFRGLLAQRLGPPFRAGRRGKSRDSGEPGSPGFSV
jgi:hypothetical protein